MEGILVPYVHGAGSIGVMVKLDSDIAADNAELLAAGKDCALQSCIPEQRVCSC